MYLRINSYFALVLGLLFFLSSCKKEELDFDKISKRVDVKHELAAPIINGSFSISRFIEQNQDSILVVENDTVKLFVRMDSILDFDVSELALLSDQVTIPYNIVADSELDITPFPDPWSPAFLKKDTVYTLRLENSMRVDRLIMEGGRLRISVNNSFNHDIDLMLVSPSITDENGDSLSRTIPVDMNGSAEEIIDLNGYTVNTNAQTTGIMNLELQFAPTIHKNLSDQRIYAGDRLDIDFIFEDINEYEIAYGFLGYKDYDYDTSIVPEWDEMIEGLTGTFNATNPKIFLNYTQTFGVQANADLNLKTYRDGINDVEINREDIVINRLQAPNDPPLEGSLIFTRNNVTNFDKLVAFPIPDSLEISTIVSTNVGVDSLESQDFMFNDSRIIFDLEVEIPMEFSADLTYRDSIKLSEFENIENVTIEYANLHYYFENAFPIGFNMQLDLFDSVSNTMLSTIYFTENPSDNYFLPPAAANNEGIVQASDIVSDTDFVALDPDQLNDLLQNATHAIVVAKLQTYELRSVKILNTSYINFQFGLEAVGSYTGYLDSDE